ncbi:MAG: ABC-three component system protein [Candidatus Dormibacteria bacterium]
MYDDVSWEVDGNPLELLQLKHHVNPTRTLGDKDVDLWRTIASWMDAHEPGDADGPALTLVTTMSAEDGTACAALRANAQDAVEAKRLLEIAARGSSAAATSAARLRFLALTDAQRSLFVGRIRVLDGATQIHDLDPELRKLLHLALPRGHEDVFMDRLWAWWYRIVVRLLQRRSGTVTVLEVTEKISDLRDQFTADNLPTLVDREDFDPAMEATYSSRPFVEQLRWISLTNTLLQKAIVDYYRAYTQSDKWIEDHLVGLNELDAFEATLKDEWERAFEFMVLGLPPDASPDRIVSEGRALFRQVTEQSQVRVRDRYSEGFFTRGKYHELADDGRVGWHREFQQRLQDFLLGEAS